MKLNIIYNFILLTFLLTSTVFAREVRIGILKHDLGSKLRQRYEKVFDFNFEYLFNEEYKFCSAIPHIGISINSKGYTNNIYSGITWHFDIRNPIFIEVSFGGTIHNAELKKAKKRRTLGSRI